jgi:glycosyltransferase involved in cell wall biosynthesis
LIRAFQQVRVGHPEIFLVLSGKDSYFWQKIKEYVQANGLGQQIIFTGYVDDRQLANLYSHALAFVFPSLSEGFGLPLLEAMKLECPVLSSQATCLPEVAGEAALYFDPGDERSLVAAMETILSDSSLAARLREAGLKRVADFSWQDMAVQTLQIYSQI